MRRSMITGIALCAAALAGTLAVFVVGCSREKAPPNVLFICVDTLRPDRLGYAGHARNTSPAADELAAAGVRFNTVYSASGWTLPSMATIFTGAYPKDHLATDFHWAMDPSLPTLAGILRGRGYDTRAYVSHVFLKPIYGFGEGFKSFDFSVLNVGHPHDVSTARQLTDLALAALPEVEEPFFMWVHYFDPHADYLTHREWAHFGNSDVDRYDQEVAFTDSQISRIIEDLKRRGMYDNTIIVFTSDHGEEFGEHGGAFHETLYNEVLLCPLVIVAPGLEPGANDTVVEQIDFLPTILGLLGVQPPAGLPGKDVLGADPAAGPVFLERDRPWPWVLRGVIDGHDKLFVVEVADSSKIPASSRGNFAEVPNVIPGIYMFDLSNDPAESTNIYSETDPRARELLALLAGHFAAPRAKTHSVTVDDELNKKLRSLGYIR